MSASPCCRASMPPARTTPRGEPVPTSPCCRGMKRTRSPLRPSPARPSRVAVTTSSGLIRGSYQNTASGAKFSFRGIAFQKQDLVAGAFVDAGLGQSDFFTISPSGSPSLDVINESTLSSVNDGDTVDFGDAGILSGAIAERNLEIRNEGVAPLLISSITVDSGTPFGRGHAGRADHRARRRFGYSQGAIPAHPGRSRRSDDHHRQQRRQPQSVHPEPHRQRPGRKQCRRRPAGFSFVGRRNSGRPLAAAVDHRHRRGDL